MPLTAKGEKIENAMKKKYGSKEGESVFYASKNAATISGIDSLIDGAAVLGERLAKVDAEEPKKEENTEAEDKKVALAKFERELGRAMGKAMKDLDANDKEMITNWLKGGISPAHAMERYSGHVKEKSIGEESNGETEAAADASGKTKDELWDAYHAVLQRQITLPPERQAELAGKVKLARRTWENARDDASPAYKTHEPGALGIGASPKVMGSLVYKAQAAYDRGDIDEGALATFQRLAQTGGPDGLGLKYGVEGKSRALSVAVADADAETMADQARQMISNRTGGSRVKELLAKRFPDATASQVQAAYQEGMNRYANRSDSVRVYRSDSLMVRDRFDKAAEGIHRLLARAEAIGKADAEEGTWEDVKRLQAEGWTSKDTDRKSQGVFVVTLIKDGKTKKLKVYG